MLSAIGLLLIIKLIPLALTFSQNYHQLKNLLIEGFEDGNNFLWMHLSFHFNSGAILISLLSLSLLIFLEKSPIKSLRTFPAAIIVIVLATLLNEYFVATHSILAQHNAHRVNIPLIDDFKDFWFKLEKPNLSNWTNPLIYLYAILIATISSLETLMNISATERLDKKHRLTDKNKELTAQGVGNIFAGLLGGLPITSVIIRTSVNIENQAKSKLATMIHGGLLLLSMLLVSEILNRIPLCVLATVLIFTGYKLTHPSIYIQIFKQGYERFIPFIATVLGVLFFNLLTGILAGLILNLLFVLRYNSQSRVDIIQEVYPTGTINRLVLPQQTTFLNKASLMAELNTIPKDSQLIIDARFCEFIDKEIIEYIQEFKEYQAPLKNIALNLIGFKDHYAIHDHINFINVTTFDAQSVLSPKEVLEILKQGNERFLNDQIIHRSNMMDIQHTSQTQHPIAVVLGCIDSRVPVETIFDMTFGDLFCVRIAGNVVNDDILASIEYACHVVGAKLIVVLGHTGCGAINAACHDFKEGHITQLLNKIKPAIQIQEKASTMINERFVENVTHLNIAHSMLEISKRSPILDQLLQEEKLGMVGAVYDVNSGRVKFSDYEKELEHFNE
jgi:carbonic anhydrase